MFFFKRKRNLYFSIIFMLTLVMGLFSVSFSYYVDETSRSGLVRLNEVDNIIQSDSLKNGVITVGPQETIEFHIYVISNNNYDSKFKLFYQTKNERDIKVYTKEDIKEVIPSHSVYEYTIVIENYSGVQEDVTIGIASSTMDSSVNAPGKVILKGEDIA